MGTWSRGQLRTCLKSEGRGEDAWQRLPAEAAAGGDGALPLLHDLHPHLRHQAPANLTTGAGTNDKCLFYRNACHCVPARASNEGPHEGS